MKSLALLALAICLPLFAGCARTYVLRTTNGTQLVAASKPKLKNGYYVYKDASGKEAYVSQGRIVEIAPAARAEKEKSIFKPTPSH